MKIWFIPLLFVCSTVNAESVAPVVGANAAPTASAMYEMMERLEQLQTEVQVLTGKLEEQAYLIAEMKKAQNTQYTDFDERFQAIESKLPSAKSSASAITEQQQNVVTDAAVKSAEQNPPAGSDVQGGDPVKPATAPPPATAKQEIVPATGDEKQQYQQAYDALRNGHTAQAIADFNALLTKNPKSEYANNAQYWLGEAYRVNQDSDSARQAFNAVIEKYPGSTKVPDALLKLGMIEAEQKNVVKAREYFTRITTDFSNSTAAKLAAKKLQLLD